MVTKNMFVIIPPKIINEAASQNKFIPTLYSHKSFLVRGFFWLRLRLIYSLIIETTVNRTNCLDFGGGGGALLPTLSRVFKNVDCGDKFCHEASYIVKHYQLKNINLYEGDLLNFSNKGAAYNAVIAADVLEHFISLREPIDKIKELLKKDGILFTSLPTENTFYVFLRKIFNIIKPEDHFHTAKEVEKFLEQEGFIKIKSIYVPLYFPILKLFHITSWKKND